MNALNSIQSGKFLYIFKEALGEIEFLNLNENSFICSFDSMLVHI